MWGSGQETCGPYRAFLLFWVFGRGREVFGPRNGELDQ